MFNSSCNTCDPCNTPVSNAEKDDVCQLTVYQCPSNGAEWKQNMLALIALRDKVCQMQSCTSERDVCQYYPVVLGSRLAVTEFNPQDVKNECSWQVFWNGQLRHPKGLGNGEYEWSVDGTDIVFETLNTETGNYEPAVIEGMASVFAKVEE